MSTLLRLALLLPLLVLAAPIHGLAAPELAPLTADVETFARSANPSAEDGRRLMHRIHLAEATYDTPAFAKRKKAGRQQLQALRDTMAAAGTLASTSLRTLSPSALETGTLRGRVQDVLANPVAWASVEIYSLEGFFVASTITDAEGRYSLDLSPASYFVYVDPGGSEFSPQMYRSLQCLIFNCNLGVATPVPVASGNTFNLDFELLSLGAIAGRVLRYEDGTPLASGSIAIFNSQGFQLQVATIRNGAYRFSGLPADIYYVATANQGDRVGLVYRDVVCPSLFLDFYIPCSLDGATPIEAFVGGTTSGIDLLLRKAATVEGRVATQNLSNPLAGARVSAYTSRERIADALTDENGHYRLEGVGPGQIFIVAESLGFTPQAYPLVDCAFSTSCFTSGQPLILQIGALRTGIDFELKSTGALTGQIFDEATGAPIDGASIEIGAVGTNTLWGNTNTDNAGQYSFNNLPAVRFYVKTITPNHVDEYFDNVDARRGVDAATFIQIEPGRTRSGIDFRLQKAGVIAATVLSADTGQPLPSCSAKAIPVGDSGGNFSTGNCQSNGRLFVEDLSPGFYYLQVEGPGTETVPFLYGSGSCNTRGDSGGLCDLGPGRLIEVNSGQASQVFDIRLERAGQIFLQINTGGGFSTGKVTLFEDLTEIRSKSLFFSAPTLQFQSLRPGRYRLVVEGAPNWQSAAWPDRFCNRWYCDPRNSGVIEVRAGEDTQLAMTLQPLYDYDGCLETPENLCLNQNRFKVRALWKDFLGNSGIGIARRLTDETGYFYFFSPNNVEVIIKMLNGCADRLGHRFWAFAAGLTNVEVQLEVTDTLTGDIALYSNGLGQTFQPILDIDAFATCDAEESASTSSTTTGAETGLLGSGSGDLVKQEIAEPAAEGLSGLCPGTCLGGKFAITANWRTPSGQSGRALSFRITDDTAGLSFFSSANIEVVVKVLDACQTSVPRHWVFVSGLTDVEIDLRIENVETGAVKVYRQSAGPFQPIIDLGTFACN